MVGEVEISVDEVGGSTQPRARHVSEQPSADNMKAAFAGRRGTKAKHSSKRRSKKRGSHSNSPTRGHPKSKGVAAQAVKALQKMHPDVTAADRVLTPRNLRPPTKEQLREKAAHR